VATSASLVIDLEGPSKDVRDLIDLYRKEFGVDMYDKDADGFIEQRFAKFVLSSSSPKTIDEFRKDVAPGSLLDRALQQLDGQSLAPGRPRNKQTCSTLTYSYRPFVTESFRRTDGVLLVLGRPGARLFAPYVLCGRCAETLNWGAC
jgi:hypothetical protein